MKKGRYRSPEVIQVLPVLAEDILVNSRTGRFVHRDLDVEIAGQESDEMDVDAESYYYEWE